MDKGLAISAVLPIVTVIVSILCVKKNSVISSLIGISVAGVLIVIMKEYQLSISQLLEAIKSALILSLSAIIVIVPGLYLANIIREQKRIDLITSWIEDLPIYPEKKVIILLMGFLPAIESLTGFGVSLFIGVPIFLKLFPKIIALKLALLGMNIMPWGTLGLATIIGSSILQQSVVKLGSLSSLTSFLVFPYVAVTSMFVLGGFNAVKKNILFSLLLSTFFSTMLFINNFYIYPETAGVIAGILTGLVGIMISFKGKGFSPLFLKGTPAKAFLPYLLVLFFVIATRIYAPITNFLNNAVIIKSDNVSFNILTSPGIILILVSYIMYRLKPVSVSLGVVLKKSRYACLSIMAFLFLSQIMLQSGMIGVLSSALYTFTGKYTAILLTPLIGMVSGFVTGSNVGGNALLIEVQGEVGHQWGNELLFAAAQNSGAGHMVFSSIPLIVLLLTIAKDINIEQDQIMNEDLLLNFTLKVSVGIYISITVILLLLLQIDIADLLF